MREPAGLQGLISLADFEAAARERLAPAVFDYYAGGAQDEITLAENRRAFDRLALRYRVLVDVGRRDLRTSLLGAAAAAPIAVAPMAFQTLAHPAGECATARAAGAAGLPMTLSTLSTASLEEVRAATAGPLWFQLYVYRDRGVTRALVERAAAAGFAALVLTVDAPLLGRRERDLRNRFHLPAGTSVANVTAGALELPPTAAGSGLGAYFAELIDPAITWRDVEWLRSITTLPLALKGVVRGDDAARAAEHGVAGVIVSNHGGRQLDTAVASLCALPEVVRAVDGRAEVLLDGGVRRGTDVVKALALGARGVLIGRPVLWGLAVAGEPGVARVLATLRDELELAMALCGCASPAAVTPDLLAAPAAAPSGVVTA